MNQTLKQKWHSIYGQILFDRKLMAAWRQVEENGGAGGIDGETIKSYKANEEQNILDLLQRLRAKTYQPSPVRRVYIPKKNGKMRPLGIPNIEDRIVQQAIVNVLSPKCEELIFHRWSCGYRPNRGAKHVAQLIMWHVETGHNHIYDCDIKGFFDNISHKKLMQILSKYIADGTVLDLIWAWLKAGYMEDGKYFDTEAGTPQGGVISPLLANLFLNELDWTLEEHGIRFARYADDFLLFAKSQEEIELAAKIAREKIEELGLEVAVEKTKIVDFNKDDFNFMGFTFKHWRKDSKTGHLHYIVLPTEASLKDFRAKVKEKTKKTLTLGPRVWIERVNTVIRGKVNHYLNLYYAMVENQKHGQKSRCKLSWFNSLLDAIDAYTRQRMRVAMLHKQPNQRRGHLMKTKWNNAFFAKIGLVSAYWFFHNKQTGFTVRQYVERLTAKAKQKAASTMQRYRERGEQYYTPDRLRKMQHAQLAARPSR